MVEKNQTLTTLFANILDQSLSNRNKEIFKMSQEDIDKIINENNSIHFNQLVMLLLPELVKNPIV